ncbi:hypothetical protein EJ04DRAFT_560438 [Polyplosphaeria fusca]|uniref:Uncharacterized protein n=1 Tax=Polyplosphaeria fusca TaxID=682080 RepID=A0A9P4R8P9_9PLEO|nr:hypothetical protein EJ04DRAFT_560438 [Polyplosphaeria fusca]
MVYLLRTLLDRPDLAIKANGLWVETVRKSVASAYKVEHFDWNCLQKGSLVTLKKLGHDGDAWSRMIEASIESAYAGLLLTLLPKLRFLDLRVYDSQSGIYSFEPTTALFGAPVMPHVAAPVFQHLECVRLPAPHFALLSEPLESLTYLKLVKMEMRNMIWLNGPGTLLGASGLGTINLKISIRLISKQYSSSYRCFAGDIINAMQCRKLKQLEITFYDEWGPEAEHDDGYLIDDLIQCVHKISRRLENDMTTVIKDLRPFSNLKRMRVPQVFLIGNNRNPNIRALIPTCLEILVIDHPTSATFGWLETLVEDMMLDDYSLKELGFTIEHFDEKRTWSQFMEQAKKIRNHGILWSGFNLLAVCCSAYFKASWRTVILATGHLEENPEIKSDIRDEDHKQSESDVVMEEL